MHEVPVQHHVIIAIAHKETAPLRICITVTFIAIFAGFSEKLTKLKSSNLNTTTECFSNPSTALTKPTAGPILESIIADGVNLLKQLVQADTVTADPVNLRANLRVRATLITVAIEDVMEADGVGQ